MWTDVVDLRDFYAGGLGQVARRMIRQRLRAMWPDLAGQSLLGLGYATPWLRPFREEAARTVAIMPPRQGVLHWPPGSPGVVALADEGALPLPDLSMDRVLVVHALEQTEQLRRMLREVWRVMAGGGRVIFVVPNRRGIWARFERTPFGHGRPWSEGQLSALLRDNMFTPLHTETALYMPPGRMRLLLGSAPAWERIGRRWFRPVAGVVLVEATKQVFAGTGEIAPGRRQRRRRPVLVASKPDQRFDGPAARGPGDDPA